jgi:hypothetical protein
MAGPVDHWRDEKQSALLYRVLAEVEKGSPREALFTELAQAAEAQGAIWAQAASRASEALPAFAPGLRVRIAALLIRRCGPRRIRPVLAALKVRGLSAYSSKAPGHEMPTRIEEVGAGHTGAGSGGNLRAAVWVSQGCSRERSPWRPASTSPCARSASSSNPRRRSESGGCWE